MKPLIQVRNLSFTYNKGLENEYQALLNITMDIYPEEFIVFFGPSGCGKSTLLNLVAGLETPEPEQMFIDDQDMATLTHRQFVNYHRKRVGMVYQSYNLIPSLSVVDNVALPQIFMNITRRARENYCLDVLERFGVRKQARKRPSELSGGQQQRIGIARAIINNPDIVLADEPVGNLDSVSAKNVLEIFRDLNEKEKKTVIMVTHNPDNLEYADRIFYMKDGSIVKEVVNRDKGRKARAIEAKPNAPTSELEELMRAYQNLSPEQINILIMPYKAKVFTHHFITTRNMEETKIFEDAMQRKLLGTIPPGEFLDTLHRPQEDGGVGFDKRTSEKISYRVDKAIKMSYFINQKWHQGKDSEGRHYPVSDAEKTEAMANYLIKNCFHEYHDIIEEEVLVRFKKAVGERISNSINKPEFFARLDMSFRDGGVGLNRKTARAVAEEMELTLIIGYGLIQRRELMKRLKKQEKLKEEADNQVAIEKNEAVSDQAAASAPEYDPMDTAVDVQPDVAVPADDGSIENTEESPQAGYSAADIAAELNQGNSAAPTDAPEEQESSPASESSAHDEDEETEAEAIARRINEQAMKRSNH